MKSLIAAAVLLIAAATSVFAWPVEVTNPFLYTHDQPTHDWLRTMSNQNRTIIEAVTVGGGSGAYSLIDDYMTNLDKVLFAGVNVSNYQELFPGWKPLSPTSTIQASDIAKQTMLTYSGAFQSAESQSRELTTENFNNIERLSTNSTTVMSAVQANTEATLAVAQQLQLVRQILIALTTVESTKATEELNEKAQAMATKQSAGDNWLTGK